MRLYIKCCNGDPQLKLFGRVKRRERPLKARRAEAEKGIKEARGRIEMHHEWRTKHEKAAARKLQGSKTTPIMQAAYEQCAKIANGAL